MKINTITCHEVYNHGASLQEYALLYYLNSNGHHAQTLHYKPPYLSGHLSLTVVSNPRFDKPILKQLYLVAKLPSRIKDLKRKKAFDLFSQKYIPTGNEEYTSNQELKNKLPIADAYICGSDQIWNSFFQNGKDPAFYLDFAPDDKLKISYAASFAIDAIDEDIKPFVREKVARLNAVGVRETSGVKILNELGLTDVEQVLDPVFLLESEHWATKFVHPISEKYVFIYDFDSNPLIMEIALKLKQEKGYKIYTVNNNITYADKNFWLYGPEKFLSLIYHSQFNITNSFHAVAFSIIFKKQFCVVNRTDKINTRMRDLLGLFGIGKNLISKYSEFEKLEDINYLLIQPTIDKSISNSKKFLLESLKK